MDYLKFNPKNQILVLNADYAPLNIVSKRKAILYVIKKKVQILSDRVVRLLSYVRLPYSRIMANNVSRRAIFTRDQHTCAYCSAKENLTVDHILPQSRGGINEWENLITSCLRCNLKKGNRTPKEADMKLLFEPYKPYNKMSLTIRNSNVGEWKEYLFA
jgi:5-methylcytosine-specific restriction endonuclease McrA